jgi:ATP-binding cassette subfamily B protein
MSDPFRPPEQGTLRTLRDIALIVPRVFSFMWEVAPGFLLVACALMVVTAAIPAAIVYMTKVIIDGVIAASGGAVDWAIVFIPLAVLFGLWVSQAVFDAASGLVQEILGERVWYSAKQRIIDKAGTLDIAFFETPRFYDQLHHANEQFYRISGISWSFLALMQQAFSLLAMVSLLSILHPLAIALLILTALPRILMEGHFARKRYDLESELVRNDRMINYMARLLTNRDSAKEIRIFTLRDVFVDRFRRFRDIYLDAIRKLAFAFFKVNVGLNLLSLIGVAGIWAYAVYQAVHGRITIGDLALVFQAAQQSRNLLSSLIASGGRVYQSALFTTRFFEFLDLDTQSVAGALAEPGKRTLPMPKPIASGIEFRNVSFKYPGSDAWILRGVSFRIPAGKRLAIAGENGAGKTTLVKLLSRLYDPSEGQILLDGQDLRDIDLAQLRKHVAVVFQDFFRYDLSAADNVGLGQVDAMEERSRVVAAARKGGAHDVIDKLPSGYDTILGKTFDEGIDLSGGEWQHLAISRAFMSDAQILVLDEPTAALDAFREHRLYEQVGALAGDKTVVFISHRFSTVRMADSIIVIKGGQVVETGNHEALMARNGHYAAMFNTQAQRYR